MGMVLIATQDGASDRSTGAMLRVNNLRFSHRSWFRLNQGHILGLSTRRFSGNGALPFPRSSQLRIFPSPRSRVTRSNAGRRMPIVFTQQTW